jgi:hypothetical protein
MKRLEAFIYEDHTMRVYRSADASKTMLCSDLLENTYNLASSRHKVLTSLRQDLIEIPVSGFALIRARHHPLLFLMW